MKTSMPQHTGTGGYRPIRSFDGDAANLERCRFPGLGLALNHSTSYRVAWECDEGYTVALSAPTEGQAIKLLAHIRATDEAYMEECLREYDGDGDAEFVTEIMPVRRNLRIEPDQQEA